MKLQSDSVSKVAPISLPLACNSIPMNERMGYMKKSIDVQPVTLLPQLFEKQNEVNRFGIFVNPVQNIFLWQHNG